MVDVGIVVGLLLMPLGALHVLTADQAANARTFFIGGLLFARSRRLRVATGWIEVAAGALLVFTAR